MQELPKINQYKSYTSGNFYLDYINRINLDSEYNVDIATYRSIIADYFKHIMERVLDHSEEFKLPGRLGKVYVVKKKPYKYNATYCGVDFKESKAHGKWIVFLNEHSDGFHYRFKWEKYLSYIRNIGMYEMTMARGNKRALAAKIKSKEVDYIDISKI